MKFIVASVVAILLLGAACASEPGGRFVGVQMVHISKEPYNVQLRNSDDETFCGGSLIASQYVRTAAHCVYGSKLDDFYAMAGGNLITQSGEERQVESISNHPEYDEENMHSDIAVRKLQSPVSGEYIKTINLCSRPVNAGDTLYVTGWGATAEKGDMSTQLHVSTLSVSARETCKKEFLGYVEKNMFCGSGAEAKSHCSGDSGGPEIYKCGGIGYQSVFTDLYAVRSFIEEFMKK